MNSPFIDPKKLEERLQSPDNYAVKHQIKGQGNRHLDSISGNRGNLPGTKHTISPQFKGLIGVLAQLDGNKEVARQFNIYPQQVSNYRNGVKPDSYGNLIPDEPVREVMQAKELEIKQQVHSKVSKLIDAISDDEISEANLQTKAKAASSLAGVIDKIGGKNNSNESARGFVFIGVPVKTEEEYSMIDITKQTRVLS